MKLFEREGEAGGVNKLTLTPSAGKWGPKQWRRLNLASNYGSFMFAFGLVENNGKQIGYLTCQTKQHIFQSTPTYSVVAYL